MTTPPWLLLLVWLLLFAAPSQAPAYSVLTHEAIIDSTWDTDIKPRLLKRFPTATAEDLRQAHGYSYGGCIIQDMGYYPFGSKFFSDLVHYIRSGEFVAALFHQAQTLDEQAFAYGALAHYFADIKGHSVAVNRSVPIEYPRLRARYGNVVTYAENPQAHIKTEFGFDVVEVSRGLYASDAYRDFVGFHVSKELLDRTYAEVYGLHLKDIFAVESLAFGSYRHAVSSLIPEATKIAWKLKEKKILQEHPGITRRKFLYTLSRSSYEKEWGRDYQKPGVFARFMAVLLRIIPRVGPFRAVAFKPPTAATERMFEESFLGAVEQYRQTLRPLPGGRLQLADLNLDTGDAVSPGKYSLADKTYAALALKLADHDPVDIPVGLQRNIVEFYAHATEPPADKKLRQQWGKVQAAVAKLKATP